MSPSPLPTLPSHLISAVAEAVTTGIHYQPHTPHAQADLTGPLDTSWKGDRDEGAAAGSLGNLILHSGRERRSEPLFGLPGF